MKQILRVQEHIGKISWSLADKMLFFGYGIVSIIQVKYLSLEDLGLFTILISINTWIFVISESFALQNIIQFGVNKQRRKRVNTYSVIIHAVVAIGISTSIYLLSQQIGMIWKVAEREKVCTILPILSLVMVPRTFCLKLLYREQRIHHVFLVNLVFFGALTLITFYYIFQYEALDYDRMVILYLSGAAVSSAFSIWISRKEIEFGLVGNFNIRTLLDFSIPNMLTAALHAIPKLLDSVLLSIFFPISQIGIYSLAKTLFRIFDEAGNAAFGLVYPAAVRLIENKNFSDLMTMITKVISFMLVSFIFCAIILESGFSSYIITTFLPKNYHFAIEQFNLLVIASFGIPFVVMSLVITALGKPRLTFAFTLLGVIASIIVFLFVGYIQKPEFAPIGIIAYFFITGGLNYLFLKKRFGYKLSMLGRALPDSYNYFRERFFVKG